MNRAVPDDYIRFFWGRKTGQPYTLSVAEIYEIWDFSDPRAWSPVGVGSGPGKPATELQISAALKGHGTSWADQAAVNGVDR